VIGVLKDPHLKNALTGIKIRRCPEDIEINRLYNLFSFTGITDNAESHAKDEAVVAVKEHTEGILPAGSDAEHEFFVREAGKIAGLHTRQLS